MSRWRAFAIHLLISVLIAGSVAAVLFLVWYPPKLLGFAGAEGLLFLMAGIDIVAGPLLTLIIFKPGKKGLKFDLALISFAQGAFLAYGVWTSWESRPVYLVAVNGSFQLVFAGQIPDEELDKARGTEYGSLPWGRPRVVGAKLGGESLLEAMEKAGQGLDVPQRPELFVDYSQVVDEVLAKSVPFSDAKIVDASMEQRLEKLKQEYPDARLSRVYWAKTSAYLLIDPTSAQPLATAWSD